MAFVAEDPDVAAASVVAGQQLPVDDCAGAESRAERDAQQVPVALRRSARLQQRVDLGQRARDGFAVGEQVAVVVDEYRNAEAPFEVGAQCDSAAKGGEVRQVADDAVGIVGRSREGEADGVRARGELPLHGFESFDQRRQHAVEVVRTGGKMHRRDDLAIGRHGREDEVRSAGVEGQNDAWVGFVHVIRSFEVVQRL